MSTEEKKHSQKHSDNNVAEKKDWQPRIANIIAGAATLISLALAIYTYKLYKIASDDSKTAEKSATAANKSAEIALKTLEETHRYDSISLLKQKETFDKQNDLFTMEHEPYLEVKIDSFKMKGDGVFRLFYKIKSLSAHPLEAVRSSGVIFPIKGDSSKFIKNVFRILGPPNPEHKYYYEGSGESAYIDLIDSKNTIRQQFIAGTVKLYFISGIEYINYLNGRNRKYECIIRMGYFNKEFGYQFLRDRNYDNN